MILRLPRPITEAIGELYIFIIAYIIVASIPKNR